MFEAPERVEAFRLRTEETLEGVRDGGWLVFECDVDVVDWEGVRRDFAMVSGYCWDEGEEMRGGFGGLRVYEEKAEVEGGWREGGKLMSGTILVNGLRSVRLEKSGAGGKGFL